MNSRFVKATAFFCVILMTSMVLSCKSKSDKSGNEGKNAEQDSLATNIGDSIVADSSFKYTDCDIMCIRDGKLWFYSIEKNDSLVFEGEHDEIVNYEFLPGSLTLYYSVCKDSSMVLKSIDFASENPEPQEIVSWGLTCNDCITETYGTYSALRLSSDGRYAGVNYDFSWDGYWFTKIKVYDLKENKFVKAKNEESLYDYFNAPSVDEEEADDDDVTSYSSFYEAGPDDDDEESEGSSYNYYYGSKEKGGVCLTDKMKFESTPEEFDFGEISPKGDRVVFGAVLGWGDFPHGPFCYASLDGKVQIILDGTDLSYDDGPSMGWLDDGTFLYVSNFMPDDDNFVQCIMMVPAEGDMEPTMVFKANNFIMLPKK